MNLKDGEACGHRACLSFKESPCPFCGRIAGRALTHSERIAKALLKYMGAKVDSDVGARWFQEVVKVVKPIVEDAFTDGVQMSPEIEFPLDTSLINTEEEAKRLAEYLSKIDLPEIVREDCGYPPAVEKDSDFSISAAMKNPERHTSDGGFLIPGAMMHDPIYTPLWRNWFGRLLLRWFRIRDKSKDTTMEKELYGVSPRPNCITSENIV